MLYIFWRIFILSGRKVLKIEYCTFWTVALTVSFSFFLSYSAKRNSFYNEEKVKNDKGEVVINYGMVEKLSK